VCDSRAFLLGIRVWVYQCGGCFSVDGCYRVIGLSGYMFRFTIGWIVCLFDFTQRSHECILSPVSFRICLADRRQWWYIHRVIYFVYIVLNELERVLDLFEVCSERK